MITMNEGQNTPNTFSITKYTGKCFTKKVPDPIFESIDATILDVCHK